MERRLLVGDNESRALHGKRAPSSTQPDHASLVDPLSAFGAKRVLNSPLINKTPYSKP